jgi:hypothetical protein
MATSESARFGASACSFIAGSGAAKEDHVFKACVTEYFRAKVAIR